MALINRRRRAWSGLAGDDQLTADNDVRSYASWHGYQNRDYDNRNFWGPREDQYSDDAEGYTSDFQYGDDVYDDDTPIRREEGRERSNGSRRSFVSRVERGVHNRRRRQRDENFRERRPENEGYHGRNAADYHGGYGNNGHYDPSGNRYGEGRGERNYGESGERDTGFYNYYKSVPSYRDDADEEFELMGNEKAFSNRGRYRNNDVYFEERGQFRHRHPGSYEEYRRRRPNIRDRK